MPGSFQATRTSELLLDLICILDPGHAHERLPRAVAQYVGMLKNHKYLSVMEKDVEKSFAGVCEKLALSGRGKETAVLKLSKEKFLERHAYAKDMCIASDLTDGTGFPVPQAMVKLLMCLANAPTAVGKHVPLDQLMDAERALAQPVLPVGLGESSDEEEEDVLGYDQWREQCALEDSDDEQDESWVLEEACSEASEEKQTAGVGAPTERRHSAFETDSESFLAEENDIVSDYEYLKYGAHISQFGSSVAVGAEPTATQRFPEFNSDYAHFQYLNHAADNALVLGNPDVCRLLLQALAGFQNDLFILSGSEDIKPQRWIKTATAYRSALSGTSIQASQSLFDWFLGLADDVQFCRCISDAVLKVSSLPIGDKKRGRQSEKSGFVFISSEGDVVEQPAECAAVFSSATLPLYAAVHRECSRLSATIADLEELLAVSDAGLRGTNKAPTVLSLHMSLQPWRQLFASVRAIVSSTRSVYLQCDLELETVSNSDAVGPTRVNRKLYDSASRDGDRSVAAVSDSAQEREFIIERSTLSSLIKYLVFDINKLWFCSTNRPHDPIDENIETSKRDFSAEADLFSRKDVYTGNVVNNYDSDSDSDYETRRRLEEEPLRLPVDAASVQRPKDLSYVFRVQLLATLLRNELSVMVSVHTGGADRKPVDTHRASSWNCTKYISDDNLYRLWDAARRNNKEFELVSRIPGVLGSTRSRRGLHGDGAVSGIFNEIGELVCDSISAFFDDYGETNRTDAETLHDGSTEPGVAARLTTTRFAASARHELFQNTSTNLLNVLQVAGDQGATPRFSDDSADQFPKIISSIHKSHDIFAVMSGASVLRLAVVAPLLAAISRTSSDAATAMIGVPRLIRGDSLGAGGMSHWSEGFKLMHHLEYIRMLFLMGGEMIRSDDVGVISNDEVRAEWTFSPGAIFVPMQELYCALLDRMVIEQHNAIGIVGATRNALNYGVSGDKSDDQKDIFLHFSPELYGLGQMMLSQLMNSLPAQTTERSASSAGSEGISHGSSVGVAVSFRAIPVVGTSLDTSGGMQGDASVSGSSLPDTSFSRSKSQNSWPSAALSDLISKHLAVDIYYPFPLNRVLSPLILNRFHRIMAELINLTTMRWAIESTWKLDKVSKAAFEDILMGYRNQEEVSTMKRCVDRCRVSLSWLMHTMKGLIYYFMSEIHDTAWEKFRDAMGVASRLSLEALGQVVEEYVLRIEGLLGLFKSHIPDILAKGHASISAYQFCLHAIREVCLCAKDTENMKSLDASYTPVIVAKCVAAIKRADLEFSKMRLSLSSFLHILESLGGGGSSGVRLWSAETAAIVRAAEMLASGGLTGGGPDRDAARVVAINETRRLHAILGGSWV